MVWDLHANFFAWGLKGDVSSFLTELKQKSGPLLVRARAPIECRNVTQTATNFHAVNFAFWRCEQSFLEGHRGEGSLPTIPTNASCAKVSGVMYWKKYESGAAANQQTRNRTHEAKRHTAPPD
mmetsp:Transcript_7535/g.18826  ORF Transcript_7535/g.18826 Transcript_7535/m.18826 type:complete len:123 (+) Transcript_7535:118-486(+)